MKIHIRLFAALLCCAMLSCCTVSGENVETSSQAETLTLYTSHWPEVYGPVVKEFEERTGIWVTVHEGGSIELLEQITRENENPVCDVLFGGGADTHELYKELFEPYRSMEEKAIRPVFHSRDNAWTAFSALPIVIVYNTKLVRDKPEEWQDLLQPKWKGDIAFVSPKISASACTALATLELACPASKPDSVRLFLENLDNRYLEKSSDIVLCVSDGQFALGVTLEEAAFRQMSLGKDLAICYPKGGTSAVPDALSLINGAPNRDNAKLFIDFAVSQDVQQMVVTELGRRSVRVDVAAPQGLPEMDKILLLDYDISKSGEFRKHALASWEEIAERKVGS